MQIHALLLLVFIKTVLSWCTGSPGKGEAILRACEPEPRASFGEPRKIPTKKSKNGHNALIWYLLHAGSITADETDDMYFFPMKPSY